MRALRRNEEARLALAEAGINAFEVLQANVPVLPGFTAEQSALARDLARRTLQPDRANGLLPLPDTGEAYLDVDNALENDTSCPPAVATDRPLSPRLRHATMLYLANGAAPPEPYRFPQDSIDAADPQSLVNLRLCACMHQAVRI